MSDVHESSKTDLKLLLCGAGPSTLCASPHTSSAPVHNEQTPCAHRPRTVPSLLQSKCAMSHPLPLPYP